MGVICQAPLAFALSVPRVLRLGKSVLRGGVVSDQFDGHPRCSFRRNEAQVGQDGLKVVPPLCFDQVRRQVGEGEPIVGCPI